MIKRNTKIDQEQRARNETETDVQVRTAERETDGGGERDGSDTRDVL